MQGKSPGPQIKDKDQYEQDLYAEAKKADIKGRSKMNKKELMHPLCNN